MWTRPGWNFVLFYQQKNGRSAVFCWWRPKWESGLIGTERKDGLRAIECSIFRNETRVRSSDLILEAIQCLYTWQHANDVSWPDGIITGVSSEKTKRGRSITSLPGECFRRAGFEPFIHSGKNLRADVWLRYIGPKLESYSPKFSERLKARQMKNKEIFSFSDAFESISDLRVVHSSLSDFAPSLARDAEFPSFPAKLGIVTRFRHTRQGYVATVESEWPSLSSTMRGELVLCVDSEELTRTKTQLLISRCESLAAELVAQADRLRTILESQKLIHALGISTSDFASSLEDSGGKPRAWEINVCDKIERKEPLERRQPRPITSASGRDSAPKSRGLDPSVLSAILADCDDD